MELTLVLVSKYLVHNDPHSGEKNKKKTTHPNDINHALPALQSPLKLGTTTNVVSPTLLNHPIR